MVIGNLKEPYPVLPKETIIKIHWTDIRVFDVWFPHRYTVLKKYSEVNTHSAKSIPFVSMYTIDIDNWWSLIFNWSTH